MINLNEKFVDKVLEDIPLLLLGILRIKKDITPYEITCIKKIMSESENVLFEYENRGNKE